MAETTDTKPDISLAAAEAAELAKLSDGQIIARRSADIHADEAPSGEHLKVFVLPPGPKPTEANGYDHRANMAATRQYAISQGLRPTGDAHLISTEPFGPGLKSWALTYGLPVMPVERIDNWVDHVGTTVITDNETDETGHVPNVKDDGQAPATSNDEAPTKSANRATIDAYAQAHGIDTSSAGTKAEALALINKQTVTK